MRTTILLDDALFREVKELAARERKPFKGLVEEGLRDLLLQRKKLMDGRPRPPVELPVSQCSGGLLPGVDLTANRGLEEVMGEGATPW